MLKWAWYGWRSVSSSDDGFFRNVTPSSCGPAVTADADLQVRVDGLVVLVRPAAA